MQNFPVRQKCTDDTLLYIADLRKDTKCTWTQNIQIFFWWRLDTFIL